MLSKSDFDFNKKTNNKHTYKKIAEYSLKLKSNLSEFKVGKINDIYNPQKCLIEKEGNTKNFKLLEKKQINDKQKNTFYTGNIIADQNSKYLIFSTKPDSNTIEIFPADNWYMFKKDINYKTMNSEEAEEKIKFRPQIIEHLKNKGNSNAIKNNKKEKKNKKNTDNLPLNTNTQKIPKNKKNFEEDSFNDEEELFNSPKRNNKKNANDFDEISEKELTDLELREMPSDLEENFFGKIDNKKIKLFDPNDDLSLGKSELNENEDIEDDDSLFEDDKKDKENSEVEDDDDDDISEIDRKYAAPNFNININLNPNEKNSNLIL
jgi:hypothetical protein